jgi:cell division septum initiation protein DivIVA
MLEQEVRETKLQPAPGPGGGATTSPAAPAGDPYERLSKRLATLLATADQEAERILEEARADAARMLDEARSDADRIRVDAQARAEEARQQGNELLERAKQEADRVLLGLSERRETLVQHLQDMQTRLVGVAKELEVAIEDPDVSSPPEPVKAEKPAPAPVAEAVAQPAETAAPGDDAPDGLDGLENMLADDGLDMPGIPPLELDFDDDPDD